VPDNAWGAVLTVSAAIGGRFAGWILENIEPAVMPELSSYVGGIAAILASLSYIPQVRKARPPGSTKDLSLGMLIALTLGLGLWDRLRSAARRLVIDTANAIGSALAAHLPWLQAT
jgi:MtN3 and saliva related transmembrane protein